MIHVSGSIAGLHEVSFVVLRHAHKLRDTVDDFTEAERVREEASGARRS